MARSYGTPKTKTITNAFALVSGREDIQKQLGGNQYTRKRHLWD